MVDEGLGDGVGASPGMRRALESVDVVRVREPDEDAVVGDADGRDGHRDGFVGEGDVSVGLECRLNWKDRIPAASHLFFVQQCWNIEEINETYI